MEPGKVIGFIENKKILLAVCLEVKKDRLHCLTEANREINLSSQRVLLKSPYTLNLVESRATLIEGVKGAVEKQESLKGEVNPQELWEMVKDEGESFSIQYLSDVVFGKRSSFDHGGAVLRALFEDRIYFKLQKDEFSPYTPFQVEHNILKIQKEAEREEMLREGSEWLKAIWDVKDVKDPPRKDEYIELLKEMAIYGEEGPNYSKTKELLRRTKLTQPDAAFKLMVKMGLWDEDENLLLYRYQIPVEWPDEMTSEVERICSQCSLEGWRNGRRDMTSLTCFSIDYETTRDVDDALSLEIRGDKNFRVGIHVTDVSAILPVDSLINEEAFDRGESIYLPEGKISMIPLLLSEDLCSLIAERERPAISIFTDLDRNGNILNFEIAPTTIEIKERLTYAEVDRGVGKDDTFTILLELSQGLRKKRIERGALILSIPEVLVRVNREKNITVEKRERETASQIIVSEFMILANWLVARFFKERGVLSIYRSQLEPREQMDSAADNLPQLLLNYRQKRLLSRAALSTLPSPHSTLGLDCYTTITSPIRRYMDLVVQRQLKSVLNGSQPEYGEEELKRIITELEITQSRIRIVEQQRLRYWLLRYLERMIGQEVTAMVLERNHRGYPLLLTDYLLEVDTHIPNGVFQPGDEVTVRVEKVDPRLEILRVSPV
jgi:exoribonuclease-2